LKQTNNELKKRIKKTETEANTILKKKEESNKALQQEMLQMKRELERREKREKNLGTDGDVQNGDLQKHIEDLEDEIDHWKAINADLENELEMLKAEASELKRSGNDDEDDASVGSLGKSAHSIGSLTSNELFFVSDSNSVRGRRSSGLPPPPDAEPATPSQRALRSVSTLWSKMRSPEPTPLPNPAIPYVPGSLDDD
jgi:hypothetical protein